RARRLARLQGEQGDGVVVVRGDAALVARQEDLLEGVPAGRSGVVSVEVEGRQLQVPAVLHLVMTGGLEDVGPLELAGPAEGAGLVDLAEPARLVERVDRTG